MQRLSFSLARLPIVICSRCFGIERLAIARVYRHMRSRPVAWSPHRLRFSANRSRCRSCTRKQCKSWRDAMEPSIPTARELLTYSKRTADISLCRLFATIGRTSPGWKRLARGCLVDLGGRAHGVEDPFKPRLRSNGVATCIRAFPFRRHIQSLNRIKITHLAASPRPFIRHGGRGHDGGLVSLCGP